MAKTTTNGTVKKKRVVATRVKVSERPKLNFGDAWEYADAPERVPVRIDSHYGHFIDGRFTKPSKFLTSLNPANEEPLAQVGQGTTSDVNKAVDAARRALPKWRKLHARERGKYLFRIARRIQERARELAILETKDGGKPIKESRDIDIPLVAQQFFYYAGWADKLHYAFPGRHANEISSHGVCAQVIPWNFPLLMAAWKLAPALACGNTCVLKPAETTPLTALRLAEILQECELPEGVVNIVTGDGRTGQALASNEGIDKLAFTGSTGVGKLLAQTAAQRGIPLTLELGGKSPNIIFEDASIDQAIEGIVQGIYFNQGHVCCAGSRLFVQESVVDEVIEKLQIRLESLRVGDPLDKNTDVGAINSKVQLDTIENYLSAGEDEGALRWSATTSRLPSRGYWCQPTFFTSVQQSHRIAREEIFGPVLAVMTFRTPEEAIQRANNTPYGLAAGVWTDKGSKIFEIASKLDAGVVWCNTYNCFDATSPFGGFKESGFGREGGMHGLRSYCKL
ncbi:MAG: aldehyde dehydrogenase family protein [Planctomycetota bacterium]|jgi:aldehyde dehydrogenase (NAD+)